MNRIIPIACVLTLLPVAATGQAARNASTEPPKTLLENTQIKVRELRMRPGEKSGAQNYPNSFVYGLTDGELVFVPAGRTPYELSFKAGEALWLPAQASAVSNESGKEVRALVVEIKEKAPVIRTKGKAKPKGQGGRKTAQAKSKAAKQ